MGSASQILSSYRRFGLIKFFENIKTVREKDPAARNFVEVILCYPGVWALFFHSFSHFLYKCHLKLIARIVSQLARFFTGIEIHPGAVIGRRCFIDHGMAVVIGETTEIGDDVTIYQGVTLGGTGKHVGKRHPTLANGVVVSTGAKVLGPFRVGENVKVGASSVVLKEIPDNCTVVGIPGQIVKAKGKPTSELDLVDLPDPIAAEIRKLQKRVRELEKKLGDKK